MDYPLVTVGMNSIAIYLAYQLTAGWIRATGKTWLGGPLDLLLVAEAAEGIYPDLR